MAKTKRRWVELNFTNPDALRAQDIPYSASLSVKEAIDSMGDSSGNFKDYFGNDPLPVIGQDVLPATLLWDRDRETLLAGVTGLAWIQISAGSSQGPTGIGGGGMGSFIQDGYPPHTISPEFLWNFADEALFVGVTGISNWVQIGAGSKGATGVGSSSSVGATGIAGYAAKFIDSSSLIDSNIFISNKSVGIDTTSPQGILHTVSTNSDPLTQQIAINVGPTDATSGTFTRIGSAFIRSDSGSLTDDGELVIIESSEPSYYLGSGHVWASGGYSNVVHHANFVFDRFGVSIFNGIGEVANNDSDGSFCVYYDKGLRIKNRLGSLSSVGYFVNFYDNPNLD